MRQRHTSAARRFTWPRFLDHLPVVACLSALSLTVSASPAGATVTIGQVGTPVSANCVDSYDWVQPTVTSGNSYIVKGAGTITSWSHIAQLGAGQRLKLKVFRPVAGSTYTVVGQDVPRDLVSGAFHTFPASIPVKAGDVLGLTSLAGGPGCAFDVPGETIYFRSGDLPDGASGSFSPDSDFRLNAAAVIVPTNKFSFGETMRNKKKGTATLTVDVPGPGELVLAGNGVKAAGSARSAATTVAAPGVVQLLIRAKGKKKRKLNENGKVKLNPSVTYTPTGGNPSTQSTKLKLKKL